MAISGTHMMAAAAKHHSIPVVVCTGLYKLSPLYPYDEDSFNVTFNPDSVLGFEEGDLIEKVTVTNPYYDYVSPDFVNLFITNQGGHPPSYLYRLMYVAVILAVLFTPFWEFVPCSCFDYAHV